MISIDTNPRLLTPGSELSAVYKSYLLDRPWSGRPHKVTSTRINSRINLLLTRYQSEKYMKYLVFLPALILILTSASCSKAVTYRPDNISPVKQQVVDFSGDWEKNYQRSDNFEIVFKDYVATIQRLIKELQENRTRNSSLNVDSGITFSRDSIIGLAKFTEEVTRMPLLHIEQDKTSVKIDRKDDFALYCEFFDKQFSSVKNPYGTENCTWSRGQLFIQITLENGLNIVHQVTLSPDARELNITTTISSREATLPITVSNYYYRYTAPKDDYSCIQTLTRKNVCKKAR